MASKALMMSSAVFLSLLGVLTLVFPYKVLAQHGTEPDGPTVLLIRMMGALYLGFAALDWASRNAVSGGAGARPLALGNFLHFALVTTMLAWEAVTHRVLPLAISAVVFGVFALCFGLVLFRPARP